jgi:hypothetical protein
MRFYVTVLTYERREEGSGRKRLYNEELHSLYTSPNIRVIKIKEDAMFETCSMHGGDKKCK